MTTVPNRAGRARWLRLAAILVPAALALLAACTDDDDDVASASDAAAKSAADANADKLALISTFAGTEGYCVAHYGMGPDGAIPDCRQRFGQCMRFQDKAQSRLEAMVATIPERTLRRCVGKARRAFSSDLNNRAVYARAQENGWTRAFAYDAVERCVAERMDLPAAPDWDDVPEPAVC